MALKPAQFSTEGGYRAMLELAKQYDPRNALREYFTNGLDALLPSNEREIGIAIIPERKRLIITDNGRGMSKEKLASLPYSIGESEKQGMVDKRGEKGLGLLAFASISDRATFVSRSQGDIDYHSLMLEVKGNQKIMTDDVVALSDSQVKSFYGIQFSRGTSVILDNINPEMMEKFFTVHNVRNLLTRLYTPALENGVIMKVGKVGKGQRILFDYAKPLEFDGEVLHELDMQAGVDDEENPLILEGRLFFNPEGTGDKVLVYSKDVLVYGNIMDIPNLERNKFWGCGKLGGYINDNFSKLRLGRDGLDMNTRQFRAWMESLQKIENSLKDVVEDKMKRIPRERETATIKAVWETLGKVYGELPLSDTKGRPLLIKAGVSGNPTRVIGASPLEERIIPRDIVKPITPKEPSDGGNGKTGGTYVADPTGDEIKVKPKKNRFALNYPVPTNFAVAESHKRSKLDVRLGTPTIYINTNHPDYKLRSGTNAVKTEDSMLRYVAYLCSKEVATAEVVLTAKSKVVSTEEALVQVSTKAEELNFAVLRALKIK